MLRSDFMKIDSDFPVFLRGIQKIIWKKCSDDKNSPDFNELERHLKHIQSRASNFEKHKSYVFWEKNLNFSPKTDIPGQQSFNSILNLNLGSYFPGEKEVD